MFKTFRSWKLSPWDWGNCEMFFWHGNWKFWKNDQMWSFLLAFFLQTFRDNLELRKLSRYNCFQEMTTEFRLYHVISFLNTFYAKMNRNCLRIFFFSKFFSRGHALYLKHIGHRRHLTVPGRFGVPSDCKSNYIVMVMLFSVVWEHFY